MAERHAKTSSESRWVRASVLLAILFVVQTWVPVAASEGNEFDDMQICSNPIAGLGGFCDQRNNVDDGTPGITEWVEGMYNFNMTSPTEIEFQASWAIREWDRSGMDLFLDPSMDVALASDNIGQNDGLPADVLRAAFDNNTDPADPSSPTVQETLLSEINSSISQLLSTWGGSTSPQTDWSDRVFLPNDAGDITEVNCATDVGLNNDNNAFEPPICISTSVVISLPIDSTYGLGQDNAASLEAALEGMLIMGSEVTTKFDVDVSPGHKGTYAIQPPSYATVTVAGGTLGERVHHAVENYHSGLWIIDWRSPSGPLAGEPFNGDLDMTMGFRQSATTEVVSVPTGSKSLDLRVVVDMSDESNAFIEVVAGIYQIQTSSLDQWGVPPLMAKDKANIPVITSDGIRMAYHTGLLDLTDLSDNIPISGIGEAIGNSNGDANVQMGDFQWTHISQPPLDPGGLNYTHGFGCLRGVHYCLEGSVAMDDSFPVFMRSISHTFPFSLADLLGGNLGEGVGFMNSVTGDDLSILLNSGVEFSTILSDDAMDAFIGNMLPSGITADLTMEIVLPTWASTADGGSSIELSYRVSGNHDGEVSLAGSDSFFWNHAICSDTVASSCTDSSTDRVCESSLKTCAYVDVSLDVSEFSMANLPLNKGVTVEFELTVDLTVHRIAVPDSMFESINTQSTSISLDVLPSDLLRLFLEIGSRGDPLTVDFPLCDTGRSYCEQSIPLSSNNNTGLPAFARDFAKDVKSFIMDESRALASDNNNNFGNLDMSGFSLELDFPYDGLVDDDEAVSDEEGLVMSLRVPRVRTTVGVDNTWAELISIAGGEEGQGYQIGVTTELVPANALVMPFLNPMVSAMDGLTGALAAGLVSAEGVRGPGNLSVPVPASALSDIGPDELGIDLGGTLTVTLPLGVQLEGITSVDSEGGSVTSVIDEQTQRQVITYDIRQGMGDDTLEFGVLLTPTWILQQLIYYLGAVIMFFVWRVRRRSVKKKRKRRALALEALEESAASPIGYIPPAPTVEVLQVADNGIVVKKRLPTA